MRGRLVIVDGIDGSGKSVLVKGLAEHFSSDGLEVFDLSRYCKEHNDFPEPEALWGYDVILSNEPTNTWTGKAIREEITKDNGRHYSAVQTAAAFSLDRHVLYNRIILPCLEAGKTVINDRSVTTSIVYQPIQAEPLTLRKVLSLEGNALALENRPDLLLIGYVPIPVALERARTRSKQDGSIFEKEAFLRKADRRFRSAWFRKLFEERGSKVHYIDMNRTIEEEVSEAYSIYKSLG